MKKLYSIAAVALIATASYAGGDITPKNTDMNIQAVEPIENINSFFDIKNGKVSGNLQTQYRYLDTDTQNNLFTTSGNLKYLTNPEAILQAGVNFYGITGFGMFDNEDRMPIFLKENGRSYSILNEVFLKAQYDFGTGKVFAKGGRFHMNEKLISSQENSKYDYPIPNSFEGAQAGVSLTNGMYVKGAWINRMSGQDNTIALDRFKTIESIAKNLNPTINDESNGLFFGKIGYNFKDSVNIAIEDLYVDNYTNTILEEVGVNVSNLFGFSLPVYVGQQYINYSSEDDSIDSDVWGVEAKVKATDKVEVFAAYNNIGDTAIPGFAYGADPLYTSMETANAYGDSNVDSFKIGGLVSCTKGNVEIAYGNFSGDTIDIDAYELVAQYDISQAFKVKGVVSYTDDGIDETTGFRVVTGYSF